MEILITLWNTAKDIVKAVIANKEAFAALAILATPSIGLRLLKR